MTTWNLNNVTAPDSAPTAASTLDNLPVVDHINIDVSNAAIYWSVKIVDPYLGHSLSGYWQDYVYQLPASRSIYAQGIIGFRFYAATPAAQLPAGQSQAQVTARVIT